MLIGLNVFWKLPCYFEIYGMGNYGIVPTKFIFTQNEQVESINGDSADLSSSSNFKTILQTIQVLGGVAWNYPFNYRKHPLALKLYAGYEVDVWIQGIQITRVLSLGTGFSDANTTNIGNIGFRGLTAGAKFSF